MVPALVVKRFNPNQILEIGQYLDGVVNDILVLPAFTIGSNGASFCE
jgi:hypothetical protein